MSKAFTKESESGDDELLISDETALPPGEKNYTTPKGMEQLRAEFERLRAAAPNSGVRKAAIEHRIAVLLARLELSEEIDPQKQPADRVLFGASVTVRDENDQKKIYRIVGVYETDPKRGLVSWRSPIAKALMNRRVGDETTLHMPRGEQLLEIINIEYI